MGARILLAVVVAAVVAPRAARAQDIKATCEGGGPGDGFVVDEAHSSFGAGTRAATLICNYTKNVEDPSGKKPPDRAGLAITVDFNCDKDAEEAWQSKTASKRRTEVHRNMPRELVLREHRTATGYAGTFDGNEKMFLRVDQGTIATLYLMSDIKGDPSDDQAPLEYDVRSFAANASGLASMMAGRVNLDCRDPDGGAAPRDAGVDAGVDAAVDAPPSDGCKPRGRVLDRLGNPVGGIQVKLSAGAIRRDAATDEQGRYEFEELAGDPPRFDPAADDVRLTVLARERAPGRFEIDDGDDIAQWQGTPFRLTGDETCERDFDATAEPPDFWPDMLELYQGLRRGFALADQLGIALDYGLPVTVYAFCQLGPCQGRGWQFAFTVTSARGYRGAVAFPYIALGPLTSTLLDDNWPDNREYHELGHFVLADAFDDQQPSNPGDQNHQGYYVNPSTTDALAEGWAEWYSMMTSKYVDGDPRPELYRVYGSYYDLELDFRPWHLKSGEELAIAGVLLDVEDGPADYPAGQPRVDLAVNGWVRVDDPTWGPVIVGAATNRGGRPTSEGTLVVAVLQDATGKTLHVSAAPTLPPDLDLGEQGRFAIPIPKQVAYDQLVVVAVEGRPGDVATDDDPLDATIDEVWSAMRDHRAADGGRLNDAADLHAALKARFGGRDGDGNGMDDVDQVFVSHGLFADDDGDKSWQPGATVGLTSHPGASPRRHLPPPEQTLVTVDTGGLDAWVTVHVDFAGAATGRAYAYVARRDDQGRITLPVVAPEAGATITVMAHAADHRPAVVARYDAATVLAATAPPPPIQVKLEKGTVEIVAVAEPVTGDPDTPAGGGGGRRGSLLLYIGGGVVTLSALGLLIAVLRRRRRT